MELWWSQREGNGQYKRVFTAEEGEGGRKRGDDQANRRLGMITGVVGIALSLLLLLMPACVLTLYVFE